METKTYKAPRRVETDRLVLRPFTAQDHADYARITADEETMLYIGMGKPNTPDLAWRTISSFLGHWEMLGYGVWAVTLRDGTLIGHAGFIDIPGWPAFELAYLLDRAHWGKGYAFEATSAAHRIAFEDLNKERVISLIRPQNAASIRLATRLGAAHEGRIEFLGGEAELYAHRPGAPGG